MKNLFLSIAFVVSSLSIFSCNNSNDPQPNVSPSAENMALVSADHSSAEFKGGNPTPDKQPTTQLFEWKLMKTVTLPMYKGLNLSSPFAIVNEDAGDISWGSDGGCYTAIKCWKVKQAILKIVDVKTVTSEYLKSLTFTQGQASWAPANSAWPNYIPDGTVIAYKTSKGEFRLVVVNSTYPVILDIYHQNYYRVY